MSMWLYQIDAQNWSPQRYRLEIWEGERWAWPVGQKRLSGQEPIPGDIVVFYNTPSGGTDFGFYGWAIILEWFENGSELYFRPVAPSDLLKMHPWRDQPARDIADAIRGKVKQGTFWYVPEELEFAVRDGIFRWIGAGVAPNPLGVGGQEKLPNPRLQATAQRTGRA
jgi:hypothetical protein